MLGAITGDAIGSAYEFNNIKFKEFQPLFHPKAKFTDDTVCTVAIADALVNGLSPVETLQNWCQRYWDNGGWGQRFNLWLGEDNPQPYGSYGNGAAMRVSPAGLLATSLEDALELAYGVTVITHNHPEGIKAGQATAAAIWMARDGCSAGSIRDALMERFGYDLNMTVDAIRPGYKFTEASQDSVPQALVCALEAVDFEDAVRNAVSIGGDSDTIAAIAGAVAEARFGIPDEIAAKAWSYLPLDMRTVMTALYRVRALASTSIYT
jgi:ADP-ribosyl-[dinitrogen reductase] hydrolase